MYVVYRLDARSKKEFWTGGAWSMNKDCAKQYASAEAGIIDIHAAGVKDVGFGTEKA